MTGLSEDDFRNLYRVYGPAVRARCRSVCGNDADADEALQETFERAWRGRQRFDGQHPLAWLQTIGRNASIDVVRKRRPWRDDPSAWLRLEDPQAPPAASRVDARRLMDHLDPEDAAILRLRHAEDWRIHEIAEHFQTSERSVRRRLEAVEKRLRSILGIAGRDSDEP